MVPAWQPSAVIADTTSSTTADMTSSTSPGTGASTEVPAPAPAPVGRCRFRPATPADAEAIAALLQAGYEVDRPQERETLEDVREELCTPWFDPATDSLVAVDGDDRVVGYGCVRRRPGAERMHQAMLFGVVHPDVRRRGVGTALLGWQVARGRQSLGSASSDGLAGSGAELPRLIRAFCEDHMTDKAALLARTGFDARRFYYMMRRDLSAPLPEALLPAGLRLVPTPAEDADLQERVRVAHTAAFAGHWGSEPILAADWERTVVRGPHYRPDLGRAVVDGDGAVLGYLTSATFEHEWAEQGFSEGWTALLGVDQRHRGKGIARALLVAGMAAYREEGLQVAGLGVDVDNPTALGLHTGLRYQPGGRETSWVLDLPA